MVDTLLVGNFGSGNIGDEMILQAALQKYPNSIIMTADPNFTAQFLKRKNLAMVPFFPSGLRSYSGWYLSSAYRNALKDLQGTINQIIFPGGGLFAIKDRACRLWAHQIQWLIKYFPEAEIIFQCQGVDIGLTPKSQRLAEKSFRTSNKISVRDENSQKALKKLDIEASLVNDIVFDYLEPLSKLEKHTTDQTPICLLNAVSPIDEELYSRIKLLLKNFSLKFILMDPLDRNNIPVGFKGEEVIIRDHETFIKTFNQADIAIGERLHFLIAASQLSGTKKTLALRAPYSEKVHSFCLTHHIQQLPEV